MHTHTNTGRSGVRRLLIGLLYIAGLLLPGISQATLEIFACEPEWATLAKDLGGDQVSVYSATTAMQDPHHVQARPSLIAKTRRADLIVCSGAELEIGWLPLLLRKAGNNKVASSRGQFYAADFVEKLDVPEKLDRSHGDVHAEGNPHVHASPGNILKIAEALSQRLGELDAENVKYYRSRYESFSKTWQEAMLRWQQETVGLKGVTVIAHHEYWRYLNQWLGIKQAATLEPLPGVSPSSRYLAGLIKTTKDENVRFIVRVAYVNEKPADWLADRTGLAVVELPASVNYQSGETLVNWFDGLIVKLNEALNTSMRNQ